MRTWPRMAPSISSTAVFAASHCATSRRAWLRSSRPGTCHLHAARRAIEQHAAEIGLERPYLLRERRLCHPDRDCRAGHRAVLGNGQEVLETARIHGNYNLLLP